MPDQAGVAGVATGGQRGQLGQLAPVRVDHTDRGTDRAVVPAHPCQQPPVGQPQQRRPAHLDTQVGPGPLPVRRRGPAELRARGGRVAPQQAEGGAVRGEDQTGLVGVPVLEQRRHPRSQVEPVGAAVEPREPRLPGGVADAVHRVVVPGGPPHPNARLTNRGGIAPGVPVGGEPGHRLERLGRLADGRRREQLQPPVGSRDEARVAQVDAGVPDDGRRDPRPTVGRRQHPERAVVAEVGPGLPEGAEPLPGVPDEVGEGAVRRPVADPTYGGDLGGGATGG